MAGVVHQGSKNLGVALLLLPMLYCYCHVANYWSQAAALLPLGGHRLEPLPNWTLLTVLDLRVVATWDTAD